MFHEIRYAFRTLRQHPGFALTAIISIALAIGANSAIFSFQDGLLLRPLAVKNPSTLVNVNSRSREGYFGGFAYADFVDLRDKNRSFDGLVAYRMIPAGIARDPNAQLQFKAGLLVSGNFFELLGVQPYLGRGLRPDEDSVPGRDAVVVLAYDFWHNELGADPSVVGRRIRLGRSGGLDFTVVGIAPESFTGVDQLLRPAFFIPVMMGPRVLGVGDEMLTDRARLSREDSFYVKARLKSGVSIQAAGADVSTLVKTIEAAYPEAQRGAGAAVRTEFQSRLDAIPILGGVVAAVSVVMLVILLIACANVMNLMLGRGRARSREIAIRLSLGAGRVRLIRQLMVESLMIALAGAGLGLLLAQAGVVFFSSWELPGDVPAKFVFQLDERVLVFTLVVSVTSAILFGLAPALGSTKADLTTALKGQSTDLPKRLFGRHMLVGLQVTGSIVLVMTSVQLYRNTTKALMANPGFTIDHRLTLRLDPEVADYSFEQTEQFYRTLVERARHTPGIQSAALSSGLPFTTEALVYSITPEGFDFGAGPRSATVQGDAVDEYYFDTFGVPILNGRAFLPTDQGNSPKVVVVNDALAQRFFGGNAVGKHLQFETDAGVRTSAEIVGVSVTGKYQSVAEPPLSHVYVPFSQRPRQVQRMTLIVETSGDPAEAAGPLREVIRSIDRNVPVFAVRSMGEVFQRNAAAIIRIFNTVFSATALMGFFLALVGLYSVVAYQVARRTREIGIRIALGAERLHIVKMITRQAATVAVIATAIGLVLTVAVRPALLTSVGRRTEGGWLSGFDPLLFGLLPVALLLVTLFAAAIPARRASTIDPQVALRQD